MTTLPIVGKPRMVKRTFYVPLKLWEAAREQADAEDLNISDVLREALERYVRSKR